jgi:hypothetical protein
MTPRGNDGIVAQTSVVGSAKKSSLKEAVVATIVLAIIALGSLTYFRRALTVAVTGPRKITAAQLASVAEADLDQPDAVEIKVDSLEAAQNSMSFSRESSRKYYWAVSGPVTFIVQSNVALQEGMPVTVAGRLTSGPQVLGGSNTDLNLPHTVVVSDNPTTQFRMYTLLLLVVFVGAAAWLRNRLSELRDPSKSKAVQALGAKGATAVQEVDAVLAGSVPSTRLGNLILGKDWIIQPVSPVKAIRRTDAAWIFGKQVKNRVNGVPAGSTYSVVIHDRHGDSFEVVVPKQEQDAMVATLAEVCPRAFVGHTDQLAELWAKERARAIAMIDEHLRTQTSARSFSSTSGTPTA